MSTDQNRADDGAQYEELLAGFLVDALDEAELERFGRMLQGPAHSGRIDEVKGLLRLQQELAERSFQRARPRRSWRMPSGGAALLAAAAAILVAIGLNHRLGSGGGGDRPGSYLSEGAQRGVGAAAVTVDLEILTEGFQRLRPGSAIPGGTPLVFRFGLSGHPTLLLLRRGPRGDVHTLNIPQPTLGDHDRWELRDGGRIQAWRAPTEPGLHSWAAIALGQGAEDWRDRSPTDVWDAWIGEVDADHAVRQGSTLSFALTTLEVLGEQ